MTQSSEKTWIQRHANAVAVMIGILLLPGFLFMMETVSWLILRANPRPAPPYFETPPGIFLPDALLGFRPAANVYRNVRLLNEQGALYDYWYTTDEYHRRKTPADHPENRSRFALFFGCSFTWGEGVNDNQTLAAQFAALAPEYHPYNYGCSAYGPQQMYLMLQNTAFLEDIPQNRGIIVYTFIDHHVDRVAGPMRLVTGWGQNTPWISLEGERLVHHGTFGQSDRPWRQGLFRLMNWSPTLILMQVDWPPERRAIDFAVTARIITESARLAQERFPESRFLVLFFSGAFYAERIKPYLDRAGVAYLDYSSLFMADGSEGPPKTLADGHPSPWAYQCVAGQLTMDLNIRPSLSSPVAELNGVSP